MVKKRDVVIFGETGTGKSSAVNLILGKKVAAISNKVVGCTFEFKKFETEEYNLYDTVGLSEGSKGSVTDGAAFVNVARLLNSLKNGVSLLVFVMKLGKITTSIEQNYKLFVDTICMKNVPVVLLVTNCEAYHDDANKSWFESNQKYFKDYRMEFKEVIMGCTMDPAIANEALSSGIKHLNVETRGKLESAISNHSLVPGWRVDKGVKFWYNSILQNLVHFLGNLFPDESRKTIGDPDFEERLYFYLRKIGMEENKACRIAKEIAIEVDGMVQKIQGD